MPENPQATGSLTSTALQYVELNLRDYWRILRKRWGIALSIGLAVLVAIYGSARRETPLYESKAVVRVTERKNLGVQYLGELIMGSGNTEISSYARIIKSLSMLERAVRELPLVNPGASEKEIRQAAQELQGAVSTRIVEAGHSLTNLIEIKVINPHPQRAADIANKVAGVFMEEDLHDKKRQASQVRHFIEQQIADVKNRLRSAEDAVGLLQQRESPTGSALPLQSKLVDIEVEKARLLDIYTPLHPEILRLEEQAAQIQKSLGQLSLSEIEFARLTREVEINSKLYTNLEERLAGARIAEAEYVGDIVLVDPALPIPSPVSPNLRFSLILGMVLGIFAGGLSALIVDQMDTSIRNIEDVESVIKVPVIGVIPHIRPGLEKPFRRRGWPWRRLDPSYIRLYSHFHPKALASEAFRTSRTILRKDRQRKLILITSTMPQEGKTTVLMNLAVVCAQTGDRVLLISLDLRRPALAATFGLRRNPGVSEILSGAIEFDSAVKQFPDFVFSGNLSLEDLLKTPGLDNLYLLPAGQIPSNPSELLSSSQLEGLFKEVRAKFDLVLIDCPPVLAITDALLMAPLVDGIVIVHQSGRTPRMALARAKAQLDAVGGKLIGAILNDVRPEAEVDTGYYYYRYRYYGHPSEKETTASG